MEDKKNKDSIVEKEKKLALWFRSRFFTGIFVFLPTIGSTSYCSDIEIPVVSHKSICKKTRGSSVFIVIIWNFRLQQLFDGLEPFQRHDE